MLLDLWAQSMAHLTSTPTDRLLCHVTLVCDRARYTIHELVWKKTIQRASQRRLAGRVRRKMAKATCAAAALVLAQLLPVKAAKNGARLHVVVVVVAALHHVHAAALHAGGWQTLMHIPQPLAATALT